MRHIYYKPNAAVSFLTLDRLGHACVLSSRPVHWFRNVHSFCQIRWLVGFATTDVTDNFADCTSVDQATDVHPAEVDTWTCEMHQ